MKTIYEELREERLLQQQLGVLPSFFTTNGYQLFKEKYLWDCNNFREQAKRVARVAASHTDDPKGWRKKFFDIIWNGWLALSTPVLANMGTKRGCPVSCSGGYVEDSIFGFYTARTEAAMLSKSGFGTSSYLGDIRPRGSAITSGGKSSGVLPEFKAFLQVSRDVTQGGVRRGAWAGYLELDHPDFWEVITYLVNNPDDANIGWIVTEKFINRLQSGDSEALAIYQKALKVKCTIGKGYFWFVDKVNNARPECYKHYGRVNKASNLCSEISLSSDVEHTFTCILSSLNLTHWPTIKDNDTIFNATVFLDCVASEFINLAKNIQGLEKAVRYTQKSRALGLGALGFHTHLQQNNIAIEDLDAHFENINIFKEIHDQSLEASKWMAKKWGEPEWCKGFGLRNTHRTAIAPNLSSALICGSVSQGIEPVFQNAYTQGSAGGEMNRINPTLLKLMKDRGVYSDDTVKDIGFKKGSVQHVDWLSDHEKRVFKTAFEIDQRVLLRLASTRQPYICQSQSLNLFFAADEDEGYISEVHKEAFLDPNIKSLYYLRSASGIQASKGECSACEG